MASATGGSGDGGGDRGSYYGKVPIIVGPQHKPKKKSALEKAMLRYLQQRHEEAVAAGQEPPFGGRYAPPSVPGVSRPFSTTVLGGTNKSQDEAGSAEPSSSPPKDA